MTSPATRTVVVASPSPRTETLAVLRVAGAIAFISYFSMAAHRPDGSSGQAALFPYQRLFRDAPAPVQRMFRQMQEGLLEAENVRASKGAWPEAHALAADGIPPFAPDPGAGVYAWRKQQDGPVVNYIGVPADGKRPAFLLFVQEPEPGDLSHLQMTTLDEEHQRLPGGMVIHVSFWMKDELAGVGEGVVKSALNDGWFQVLSGAKKSEASPPTGVPR
ncbi:MAG: hypothetical protein U0166_13740 [Acidobacteriota bacterium]